MPIYFRRYKQVKRKRLMSKSLALHIWLGVHEMRGYRKQILTAIVRRAAQRDNRFYKMHATYSATGTRRVDRKTCSHIYAHAFGRPIINRRVRRERDGQTDVYTKRQCVRIVLNHLQPK